MKNKYRKKGKMVFFCIKIFLIAKLFNFYILLILKKFLHSPLHPVLHEVVADGPGQSAQQPLVEPCVEDHVVGKALGAHPVEDPRAPTGGDGDAAGDA
jgi:hypothetical protein